jgi:hypothetical protein
MCFAIEQYGVVIQGSTVLLYQAVRIIAEYYFAIDCRIAEVYIYVSSSSIFQYLNNFEEYFRVYESIHMEYEF